MTIDMPSAKTLMAWLASVCLCLSLPPIVVSVLLFVSEIRDSINNDADQ